MADVIMFITGALLSVIWFGIGMMFGAAYARATDDRFTTPDGIITFNLNKLLEFEERRLDKQLEDNDRDNN